MRLKSEDEKKVNDERNKELIRCCGISQEIPDHHNSNDKKEEELLLNDPKASDYVELQTFCRGQVGQCNGDDDYDNNEYCREGENMFAAHICGEVGWLRQRIDNRYRSPPPKEHAGKRCGDVIHIIRDVKVSEFCTDNHTCMACCKGKPEFCVFPEIKDDLLKQVAKLVPGSTNKKKCYHCYTTFIFLTYGKVGNGVQYRIPQCVIDQIRKLYPDLNGKYKGFISLCPIHKLKKHQAKKKQKKDSYNVGDCALKDSELPLLYG